MTAGALSTRCFRRRAHRAQGSRQLTVGRWGRGAFPGEGVLDQERSEEEEEGAGWGEAS